MSKRPFFLPPPPPPPRPPLGVLVPRPPGARCDKTIIRCSSQKGVAESGSSSSKRPRHSAVDKTQIVPLSKDVPSSVRSSCHSSTQKCGPSFHIVFLIDTSRSMEQRDVMETDKRITSRIKAVWNAVEGFSNLLKEHPDIVASVVLFNDDATIECQSVRFLGPRGLLERLNELRGLKPRLGGKYVPALQRLRDLHQSSPDSVTVGVMLSDGRPGDSPMEAVRFVKDLREKIGSKLLVHCVMFGPEAIINGSCLQRIAEAGGGQFHANDKLDATALQTTFLRLSASVSTMRSSVLAFGENALKRIPEKQLEAEETAAWTQPTQEQLQQSNAVRAVKGYLVLPPKGGSEMDLQRFGDERKAYLHARPFAQGAQRYASHLWWIAPSGKVWHLVVKESKFEGAHETPEKVHGFFLKNHRRAQDLSAEFNKKLSSCREGLPSDAKIRFTPAYVVELIDPAYTNVRFLTAEKYVEGKYVKYNANDGWVNCDIQGLEESQCASAFSHFSFQQSNGDELCVDIQGVGFKWTDPQLHSKTQSYGAGDLGKEGMKLFFRSHVCNKYCTCLGLKAVNAEDLSMQTYVNQSSHDKSCLLCLDGDRTVVNRPCGHLCLCYTCYQSEPKIAAKCLVCRNDVSSIFNLTASEAVHHSTYYDKNVKACFAQPLKPLLKQSVFDE